MSENDIVINELGYVKAGEWERTFYEWKPNKIYARTWNSGSDTDVYDFSQLMTALLQSDELFPQDVRLYTNDDYKSLDSLLPKFLAQMSDRGAPAIATLVCHSAGRRSKFEVGYSVQRSAIEEQELVDAGYQVVISGYISIGKAVVVK